MLPFTSPPKTGNERDTLVGFLNAQRALPLWKLDGLDEDQARRPMVESGTSLLGLIKHLAWVELWWFASYIGGEDVDFPWSEEDPDADWRIESDETIASISQLYIDAVRRADSVIAAAENLDIVGTSLSESRSLRWVLTHMIDETARHAGHADILRELIDGTTGDYPPDD
ncbi:MAG: DinB family protein [Actinomycetota bacterium]|nr:DinB family protein [Actinomycetota bacterium]